jgi:UV DNA damage endonuclease
MLTLCCHFQISSIKRDGSIKWTNGMEERLLQFGAFNAGKYSDEQILGTYLNNVNNLRDMLKKISSEGIRGFRVSSNLLPLFDIVKESIPNNPAILSSLKEIGDFVKLKGMRLSQHPSQFVVLSSKSPDVIEKAKKELHYHNWLFDQMGLPNTPYYSVNVHGGARGESAKLIETINSLHDNLRARLTLENDESSYSTEDLMAVHKETGTPVVWDSHHHSFNPGTLSTEDAMEFAMTSWGDIQPTTHLSNTTPGLEAGSFTDRRKHSDYVHYIPDCQRIAANTDKINIDMEFKMKNIALHKAVKDFDIAY